MAELQYIEVSKIYPHPDNPRKNLGDIQELSDSIKATGVWQRPRKPACRRFPVWPWK